MRFGVIEIVATWGDGVNCLCVEMDCGPIYIAMNLAMSSSIGIIDVVMLNSGGHVNCRRNMLLVNGWARLSRLMANRAATRLSSDIYNFNQIYVNAVKFPLGLTI